MLPVLLTLFVSLSGHAFDDSQIQNLAKDHKWTSLLEYRSSTFGADQSIVLSPDFFLSPKGSVDPAEELKATLLAMAEPVGANPNLHAQCRFPARLDWLKKVANTEAASWTQIDCPDFQTFSYKGSIESISLVFATGYLANPASYFGHPLIKFNISRSKMASSLLDVSVNYGAMTPANENPFVYAAKGLFGGYDATFSHRHFHYNNHAYGEVELRDMWEYQVNLTPEEVRFFYAHTWELLGKRFPYYFFSENCASAAAHMIESATGLRIMPKLLPYAVPYTVFDRMMELKRADGTPLVLSVKLIPSRQTRLTSRYQQLDQAQRKVVENVVKNEKVSEDLTSLPEDKKMGVVETLFDYFSFRSLLDREDQDREKANPKFGAVKQQLLAERLKLPVSQGSEALTSHLRPPHEGPRPFLTRLGAIQSTRFGSGTEFQFRTTYYDLLSLDFGRPKNSEVRTLDVTLDFVESAVWLRKADLISVSTLNMSQTGLPGDGGWAWNFTMGFESLHLACRDCTLFKVDAGYGKAFLIQDRQVFFVMMDARVQTPTAGSGQLAATPRAGALIDWLSSGVLKTELSIAYRAYIDRQDADGAIYRAETRLGFGRDWDFRAGYDKHFEEVSRLSVSRYW